MSVTDAVPFPGDALWPDTDDLLGADVAASIARAAPSADESTVPPTSSLDALRASGWPGLAVPTDFRGAGASLLQCCALQRRLGSADPGLAIAVNMHLFSVGLMREHWQRRNDVSWLLLEAIATQNRLVASAFAEPNLGGSVVRSTLRARRYAGGWEITGAKTPCSLAAEADVVCLQAQTDPAAGPERVIVLLVPTTAPGVSVQRTWNTLGMRGSASHTLRLDAVRIPDELVFYTGPVGEQDEIVAAGVVWFALTSVAVYLGVARAAAQATTALLTRLRVAHLDAPRADLPSYQQPVGEHLGRMLTVEAACAGLARQADAGMDMSTLLPAALGLKQHSADVLTDAVAAWIESSGGPAYSRSQPLERLWRDVQAIRFHPPSRAASRQYLGRLMLGRPGGLDLDECPVGRHADDDVTERTSPQGSVV